MKYANLLISFDYCNGIMSNGVIIEYSDCLSCITGLEFHPKSRKTTGKNRLAFPSNQEYRDCADPSGTQANSPLSSVVTLIRKYSTEHVTYYNIISSLHSFRHVTAIYSSMYP